RWDAFVEWARGLREGDAEAPLNEVDLGPPVPRPAKVFAIGLNYREHAGEAGLELPKTPMVFTKFPSCLVGPRAPVVLSSAYVDWEVELVACLASLCTREPGGLIFTGTPSGVGSTRSPRRYLTEGDEIVSRIEHIGTMVNPCVARRAEG